MPDIYTYIHAYTYICIHTYIYIKEICKGTIYIYIKSKLGITHFAHNYMETSHVASKPKFLKL